MTGWKDEYVRLKKIGNNVTFNNAGSGPFCRASYVITELSEVCGHLLAEVELHRPIKVAVFRRYGKLLNKLFISSPVKAITETSTGMTIETAQGKYLLYRQPLPGYLEANL